MQFSVPRAASNGYGRSQALKFTCLLYTRRAARDVRWRSPSIDGRQSQFAKNVVEGFAIRLIVIVFIRLLVLL